MLGFRSMYDLAQAYRGWINESMKEESHSRDGKWPESVTVGSKAFVETTKGKLGIKAKGRKVIGKGGSYEPREAAAPYRSILRHENAVLRTQNAYYGEDIARKSTTTPKKGGLNGASKRVFDKTILTAEAQRTQSLLFDLFSFERKENK